MKKIFGFLILIIFSFCFTQENTNSEGRSDTAEKNEIEKLSDMQNKESQTENEEKEFKDLPSGYRAISLGMDFEAVKEALKEDSIFGFRGDRDISLLPGKNRSLIETNGSLNIKRAWFQFYEEKLYIIIIQMDTDKIDYYSIYSALCEKYGEPNEIDPKRAIWKNENISMILERPLAIKYMDLNVFNELLEKSQTDKAYSDIFREEFINEF